MLTRRGKLTVAQASRPAVVLDCASCGGQAIFVVDAETADDVHVEHRCGTTVVGATWVLIERPYRSARERAAALLAGGVHTAEQAAAVLDRDVAAERMLELALARPA